MTSWLIGIALSIFFRLLPFIVGVIFWKRYNRGERALIVLFGFDVISIVIGAFLAYYYHNNIIVFHFYICTEIFVLSIFFQQYFYSSGAKKALKWIPKLYFILYLVYLLYTRQWFEDAPAFSAIEVIFIILLSAISLAQISSDDDNLIRQGRFWIVTGLLIFTLINGGYFIMNYWLISSNYELSASLQVITKYSYYFVNVLFALGLWLIAKEHKSITKA